MSVHPTVKNRHAESAWPTAAHTDGDTIVFFRRSDVGLCHEFDVLEYRDTVTIVRDRIPAVIKKGMTLERVTADMFVEAADKSLATDIHR